MLKRSASTPINADLHCHSTVSDGLLAPREVAARAAAHGVTLWALTDHDEVGGQAAAREAAESLGMDYLPGVEISVTWAGRTLHIVGLGIDPDDAALVQGLARTRSGRSARAEDMAEALGKLGIHGAYEGALSYAGNPDMISRTHFARFLVEHGHCRDIAEVFDRYLGDGKPGFVPHRWARPADAIGWIRGAGGVAVMAHPGRYTLTLLEHEALFDEFKDLGGEGVEVITGSHTPDQYARYADVARRYGLLASRGSDFHGPGEGRVELGELPSLPDNLTPVWNRWLS
ncbi:3',5'-nucleoside bisphosphate phosphatase [Ralstonia solanacearum]|uniref:3',5'-nucleoside bisphosphate phosphatase n=1 Tax=Ralstonia solanacearum TaxID=305 RepID=UPI000F60B747|nr:3',5'-nucleoside bisphosphate phosphatase [Ralstonia solanacearum]MCL9846479.1 PHP domain-containing protein [Ralstonia solanacearum]MDC6254618.1 PHP domain-containing protein [Ralstonia solanacearum]MDC6259139.1 PHP domain-containing protein [Ralstonia solanacearum]MDC6303992.1 PHP domain-containing protein [Ralstonia solanacearum]